MKRREFMAGLGGAVAWPLTARAQRTATPVIGYLDMTSLDAAGALVTAFHQGLAEVGYIVGRNVAIEYRWAEGHYDRLQALAVDLASRQVAVIAAVGGLTSLLAAKAASTTIPIVFGLGVDPVDAGVVPSLNRPGGNLTGFASLLSAVVAKRLELLREAVPTANAIAVLTNPTNRGHEPQLIELEAAARVLGVRLVTVNASNQDDFEPTFAIIQQQQAGALLVLGDPLFRIRNKQLIALATRYAVPAMYLFPGDTAAGGLMSYGPDVNDLYRQIGIYAGRILKGEKPADMPVQQVTKLHLSLNLRVAKMLGLTVPLPLLALADEVIE